MARSRMAHKKSIFNDLMAALNQSLANVRGELTLRTTTLPMPPPPAKPKGVATLRKRLRMSQGVFAAYLNVSPKTVQSWEQGSRVPKAGELRLLQIVETAPEEFQKILSQATAGKAGSPRPRRRRLAS